MGTSLWPKAYSVRKRATIARRALNGREEPGEVGMITSGNPRLSVLVGDCCFVNLIQTRTFLEKGLLEDWPVGKPVRHFLDSFSVGEPRPL